MESLSASVTEYWQAVDLFCSLCRRKLTENLVSVIVVGSLSVGDIMPGWSDVDAYLVVRSVTDSVRRTAAALAAEVAVQFPFLSTDRGPVFGVFVVSRDQAFQGGGEVSFLSQWDMKRHGVVRCGEDFLASLPEPEIDREWVTKHLDWMSAFLERENDAPAFGFVLSGARAVLLKDGVYAKKKAEIVEDFARLHPDKAALVRRAMDLRSRWRQVQKDREALESMFGDAQDFLRWARALPQ